MAAMGFRRAPVNLRDLFHSLTFVQPRYFLDYYFYLDLMKRYVVTPFLYWTRLERATPWHALPSVFGSPEEALQKYHAFRRAGWKELLMIGQIIKALSPRSVVDAGCGIGWALRALKEEGYLPENACGIDFAPGRIQDAQVLNQDLDLRFIVGDLRESLPVHAELIYAWSVLGAHRDKEDKRKVLLNLLKASDTLVLLEAQNYYFRVWWPADYREIIAGCGGVTILRRRLPYRWITNPRLRGPQYPFYELMLCAKKDGGRESDLKALSQEILALLQREPDTLGEEK